MTISESENIIWEVGQLTKARCGGFSHKNGLTISSVLPLLFTLSATLN